jgi:hypothetical protein
MSQGYGAQPEAGSSDRHSTALINNLQRATTLDNSLEIAPTL